MAKKKQTKSKHSTSSKGVKAASHTAKKSPVVDRGILIFGAAIIVIIALVVLFKYKIPLNSSNEVVATVNGVDITQSDLDLYYNLEVPQEARFQMSKADYLEKGLIPQILLFQEAQKKGIVFTVEDAQNQFDNMIVQALEAGFSKEDVLQQFEDNNISLEDYLNTVVIKLTVIELLNQSVEIKEVTDVMVKEFYDTNKETYFMSEGAAVPFEEVKDTIRAALESENQRLAFTEFVEPYVAGLKQDAQITINLKQE